MISTETRSDFADWISPILVKELRQGMRSRIFMSAFYLTQLLMILCVIFGLTAVSGTGRSDGSSFINGLFWFMISVPLLFMMPIRGFGALFEEIKSGTLELVFLTHLTAWRIAAGKWMAIMVQTLLLVCSVLPYVLLRYFLGGVDIIADIQNLFLLLVGSAVLTALTVAISPYESKLLRALFMVGLVIGFFMSFVSVIQIIVVASYTGGGPRGSLAPWEIYVVLAAYVPAFLILALEMAASRIAPPAENHALRKRLVGLYLLVMPALMFLLGEAEGKSALVISTLLLALLLVDALGEPIAMVRSLYQPFLRRGQPGRTAALFFTPGWPSASWYMLLVTGLAGAGLAFGGLLAGDKETLMFLSAVGMITFPAALIRLFIPSTRYFLGFYIALQFFFAAVTFLTAMVSEFTDNSVVYALCPLPTCSLILNATGQVDVPMMGVFVTFTGLSTVAAILILLVRTFTPLRNTQVMLTMPEQPHA